MSSGTSCNADTIGSTLEELMRSLAPITGILSGGDTLAGGGAAEAGDRVHGLPFRATGARRACVSEEIRRDTKRLRRTFLVQNGALFILARRGIQAARYHARRIALAPLSRKGLWSRHACSYSFDGCKQ